MTEPLFSRALDADPKVKAWLASLSEKDRASLRDDVTPMFKEVPCDADYFARIRESEAHTDVVDYFARATGVTERAAYDDIVEDVLDTMRRTSQGEIFPEMNKGLLGRVMRAAREELPDWQFRAFTLWFQGSNRSRIAKTLGVSRIAVRSALDGEGHKGGPGAIATFMAAILDDETFKKAVHDVATKNKSKSDNRALYWFKGLDNRPAMVVPLAMLMVLDDLADARREVPVADVIPHFPRSTISECMRLLKAHGFASSDGHKIKIVNTPMTREAA